MTQTETNEVEKVARQAAEKIAEAVNDDLEAAHIYAEIVADSIVSIILSELTTFAEGVRAEQREADANEAADLPCNCDLAHLGHHVTCPKGIAAAIRKEGGG